MSKNNMFSTNTFRGGVGWLCLIVGLVCYGIGYFTFDNNHSVWREIVIKGGDVLIIGVILGYLTNAAQFIGIFKGELQDIIYGKEFLEKRKDIKQIWETISKIMFKNKFPTIHRDLLNTVNSYFPKDEVSYYNDFETHTTIEWENQNDGIIKVTDVVSFELIAENSGRFEYPLKTWAVLKRGESYPETSLDIEVNGHAPKKIIDKGVKPDTDGNYCKEQRIVLEGDTKYAIKYTRVKVYNVNKDYYLGLRAKYLINNLRVCLDLPEGLVAQFVCRGTQKDFDTVNNNEKRIEKKYKGIVLPRQGYIFALRKLNRNY